MRRSEQREHIFKLLFMTQFNSEDEMSDQVSMYFETLGELEEKGSGGNAGEVSAYSGTSGRDRPDPE